ncbi:MAG: TolC family protein [Bacteroidales bacterium]
MKKGIYLLLFVSLVWSSTTNASDTLRVDLPKALEISLSDNPTIKIADKQINRVDYSKQAAWYALLPSLNGTAQYTRNVTKQTMSMGGTAIKIGQDNTAALGVSLSLPILVPSLWYSIQMSTLDMKVAIENARASKITLRDEVKKAFYNILLAYASHETIKESHNIAKRNYEDVGNRYKVGSVAEYDMVSAEVNMRNLVPNLLQAENAIRQSKLMLKMLMGVDTQVELDIEGKLTDFEGELKQAINDSILVLDNNPDLVNLKLQKEILDKSLKIQRTQRMPNLTGVGNWQYQGMGNDNEEASAFNPSDVTPAGMRWFDPALSLGLQLNVPIFAGFSNSIKEKQIKIQALEVELQRDYLSQSLSVQATASIDNMKKAAEEVESNKESVRLAEKGYNISEKRYETGVGTILELQNSALALTQSRLSYAQSISDYLTAKSEYEKIIGM